MRAPVSPTPSSGPIVACPSCKGDSVFAPDNKWRPFCSERCKNYDLGAWASESFRVPSAVPPLDDAFGDAKLENFH
jgi:endogenous inhibitor of DNA gyrase (YacG/DUF329 family)